GAISRPPDEGGRSGIRHFPVGQERRQLQRNTGGADLPPAEARRAQPRDLARARIQRHRNSSSARQKDFMTPQSCSFRGPLGAVFHGAFGRGLPRGLRIRGVAFLLGCTLIAMLAPFAGGQTRKVRVAVPGYTIAVLSFLAAK